MDNSYLVTVAVRETPPEMRSAICQELRRVFSRPWLVTRNDAELQASTVLLIDDETKNLVCKAATEAAWRVNQQYCPVQVCFHLLDDAEADKRQLTPSDYQPTPPREQGIRDVMFYIRARCRDDCDTDAVATWLEKAAFASMMMQPSKWESGGLLDITGSGIVEEAQNHWVVLEVDGGAVVATTASPANTRIIVVDWDTEGCDDAYEIEDADGHTLSAFVHEEVASAHLASTTKRLLQAASIDLEGGVR